VSSAYLNQLLWLIPFFPLVGFACNGLLSLGGARSGHGPHRGIVALIAVLAPVGSFVVVLAQLLRLTDHNFAYTQPLWTWMTIGQVELSLGLRFDRLAALMLLFVTGIGALIHLYSVGYMWADRGFARFMAWLNLFMFSMIMLVLGDSLPATFLGWEGVGLCSYLLIGFWHRDHANNDAARKAFIVNRVGDLGFLLGAFALIATMGSIVGSLTQSPTQAVAVHGATLAKSIGLDYAGIAQFFQAFHASAALDPAVASGLAQALAAHAPWLTIALLLIFLGCTGKSAQIPLFTWLPDAMAGPTPVSALIHAATMVTSGVYLCARLSDVLVLSPLTMQVILVIGCLTAAYGAIAGLVQWDIKKVLAYSTISQLGFMFMAVGVGAFDVALFHVFTHAFFKATLFLGAGSLIHALHHEQDLRRMGGLAKLMPVTYAAMWFGWFAIIGLPGGSGFMSKDLILERLFHAPGLGPVVGVAALVIALLTAIYMTRLMYFAFWNPSRIPEPARAHVHEPSWTMAVPVTILGFGSMIAGVAWCEPIGQYAFRDFLAPVLGKAQAAAAGLTSAGLAAAAAARAKAPPHVDWASLAAGLTAAAAGLFIARLMFRPGPTSLQPAPLSGFAATWTFAADRFYHAVVVLPVHFFGRALARVFDEALIGGLARSVANLAWFLGEGYAVVQRGRLRVSLAFSVLGVLIILGVLLWGTP